MKTLQFTITHDRATFGKFPINKYIDAPQVLFITSKEEGNLEKITFVMDNTKPINSENACYQLGISVILNTVKEL